MRFTKNFTRKSLKAIAGGAVLAVAIPTIAIAASPFDDIDPSAFYADAVEWAYDNNITTGTSPTTFSPDDNVTRGQNVTFAKRYHDNVAAPATATAQAAADAAQTDADANASAIAASKFINLPTIFDVESDDSDAPWGSGFFHATVMLPPDYTAGTPMTLRVNLIASDDPCELNLRANYQYVYRDGFGNLDDNGGSVTGGLATPTLVEFASTTGRASRTVDIEIVAPGTIPLEPNDGMSIGLFFGGTSTCADAHVHAAMLLYS
jgi:hypothetical protein